MSRKGVLKKFSLSDNKMSSDHLDKDVTNEPRTSSNTLRIVKVLALIMIVTAVVLIALFPEKRTLYTRIFLQWLSEHKVAGPIALVFAFIAATIFLLPALIITLGTGVALMKAYQSLWMTLGIGSISIFVGTWLGSIAAMLIARYLFRDAAERYAKKYKYLLAFDQAIETEGLKLALLMRMCPLIPFNVQNYLMGATSIGLRDYALGGIGMYPWIVTFLFFGTTVSDIQDAVNGSFGQSKLVLAGLVTAAILMLVTLLVVSHSVRKQLKKMLETQDDS